MTDSDRLAAAADRLDELADTAELMGDDHNATRMRTRSSQLRLEAMSRLSPHDGRQKRRS